jgi:hypothetical protein
VSERSEWIEIWERQQRLREKEEEAITQIVNILMGIPMTDVKSVLMKAYWMWRKKRGLKGR